ncbi:MAG: carboxypeptidase M32, partial [Planctomycetota bacterium]|nr:carboxypeptidase M32 [Planctomycetota bacterium]
MLAAYDELLSHHRQLQLLTSTAEVLSWDQETGMPTGGGDLRARQLALLAELVHTRQTDTRIQGWLATCEADGELAADPQAAANVRGWRRDYARATRLPVALVAELAEHESAAQQAWAQARRKSDYASFAPLLERMLELQRSKADCLRQDGQTRWDALADLYEPGMNAADLRALFGPLRERLVQLRLRLEEHGTRPDDSFADIEFAEGSQEAFVRFVLRAMGFDFERGRLDRSAHPFCTGSGNDVRLTTRFARNNVLDALGSTMHEGGHGLYEQGLEGRWAGTPMGQAVSLGIHESQSRLWENHVGRSQAFWQWCRPVARTHLGNRVEAYDAERLFRAANVVTPSAIRVEADEATYDLHVMVRFALETDLIDEELSVGDLPERWNQLYREQLGVEIPDDRTGCLQDVHWSCGLFGYFPTYTLGNLYAAQFAAAAHVALPDLDEQLAKGEFRPLRRWLTDNVHRHGRCHAPGELC